MEEKPTNKRKTLITVGIAIVGLVVLNCICCSITRRFLDYTSESKATSTAQAIAIATEVARPFDTPIPPISTQTVQPTYTPFPTLTPWPTYTPYPTYTPHIIIVTITSSPTPEFTPTETATPSKTPTPTKIPTPTFTATPFNVAGCKRFSFSRIGENEDAKKAIDAQLMKFVGKCGIFYYQIAELLGSTNEWGLGEDFIYMFSIDLIIDNLTPPGVSKPEGFSKVWGILEAPSEEKKPWVLRLRKAEVYPQNQWPKEEAGLFNVGINMEMSPGIWKSGLLPTWTDSCYWARINPATGDIKDNHFGIGGVTVRVYEGEVFETNGDCTPWYYIGP